MPTPQIDPRVDAYIQDAPDFAQPILEKVRKAFHKGCPDLTENIKWGIPSFERNGLIGGMAFFKAHVSYGFWRAAEMEDPHDLLGEVRKASPMRIQARTPKELPTQTILVSYVKQARRLDEEAPKKKQSAKPKKAAAKLPVDLSAAIKKNKAAAAFWKTLAPGYRKDYIEWVTGAKREATREKRLKTTLEWLSEGKTKNWKYMDC